MSNATQAVESLLVEQTLATARLLIQCAEPLKALKWLTETAPAPALETAEVKEMARSLRVQIDHAFSDEAYLERYGVRFKELYKLGTEPKPFADRGLLELDRAKRTMALMERLQPSRVLSIGAGDCTLEREILLRFAQVHLTVSELNDTASEAVTLLQTEFPGRVSSTGRFDVVCDRAGGFDVVLCLEVIEHVQDPVLLLQNIKTALKPTGTAVVSTPNALDWVEKVHIDRFGDKNWYQHLRAYTTRTLNRDFLTAGLLPTVRETPQFTLFVTASPGPVSAPVIHAEHVLDQWKQSSLEFIRGLPAGDTVFTDASLVESGAVLRSVAGVLVLPRRYSSCSLPSSPKTE